MVFVRNGSTTYCRRSIPVYICTTLDRSVALEPDRLKLVIPLHWMADPKLNRHAVYVDEEVLAWLADLGFLARDLRRVKAFQPTHYAGVPIPFAGREETLVTAKYLSLWLLWDDAVAESTENRWRITADQVLRPDACLSATRFEDAWLCLFRELSATMSPAWIEALCGVMATWCSAAHAEAELSKQWKKEDKRFSFERSLSSRVDTIGMSAAARLVEYANGFEMPESFHDHPTARSLKTLANRIAALGSDIFSLGKDFASGEMNAILALKHELSVSMVEALCRAILMHNEAIVDFDNVAGTLPSFGPPCDAWVGGWLQGLRYSCTGFTMWDSGATRSSEFKLLVDGIKVDPSFSFHGGRARRRDTRPPVRRS